VETSASVKFEGVEREAQAFIDGLACILESPGNEITRITPSVKIGRRYLHVRKGEFDYSITLEVRRNDQ
jgi:hypothetical protein